MRVIFQIPIEYMHDLTKYKKFICKWMEKMNSNSSQISKNFIIF